MGQEASRTLISIAPPTIINIIYIMQQNNDVQLQEINLKEQKNKSENEDEYYSIEPSQKKSQKSKPSDVFKSQKSKASDVFYSASEGEEQGFFDNLFNGVTHSPPHHLENLQRDQVQALFRPAGPQRRILQHGQAGQGKTPRAERQAKPLDQEESRRDRHESASHAKTTTAGKTQGSLHV